MLPARVTRGWPRARTRRWAGGLGASKRMCERARGTRVTAVRRATVCVTTRRWLAGYVRALAGLELPAPPGVFRRLCARVVGVGRCVGSECAINILRSRMCSTFRCASLRGLRALFHRAAASVIGQSSGDRGLRPPERGRGCSSKRTPLLCSTRPGGRSGDRSRQDSWRNTPECDRRQSGDGSASALP